MCADLRKILINAAFLGVLLINAICYCTAHPTILAPTIRQNNYQLNSTDNEYKLRITHPDGSKRDETVTLTGEGTDDEQLSVNGTIDLYFEKPLGRLVMSYVAGKQGYVVRFKYTSVTFEDRLSPKALMTAAG